MRHYIPVVDREHYQPNEFYTCGHGCGNTTFTTLPRTSLRLTELQFCTKCGVGIVFCTVEMPRKVGSPMSRRLWGEPVRVLPTSIPHETEYLVQRNLF